MFVTRLFLLLFPVIYTLLLFTALLLPSGSAPGMTPFETHSIPLTTRRTICKMVPFRPHTSNAQFTKLHPSRPSSCWILPPFLPPPLSYTAFPLLFLASGLPTQSPFAPNRGATPFALTINSVHNTLSTPSCFNTQSASPSLSAVSPLLLPYLPLPPCHSSHHAFQPPPFT